MHEDSDTIAKRALCDEMMKQLSSSLEFLNEVRDFYFKEAPDQF